MRNIGYLSSVFLILCGLPELYLGLTTGNVGASYGLLILWFIGEVLGLIYTINRKDLPLILNYSFNTLIVGAILCLKINS